MTSHDKDEEYWKTIGYRAMTLAKWKTIEYSVRAIECGPTKLVGTASYFAAFS